MIRAAIGNIFGALVLMLVSAPLERAQEPAPGRTDAAATGGVYVGGQFGVVGGSSLWSAYELVDGSGSHFGGFDVGFLQRRPYGLVYGGEADLSFGAEPRADTGSGTARQLFGTVRGRIGYGPGQRLFVYGTGGLAWARDQLTGDPPTRETTPISVFRQRVGWTGGVGIERSVDRRWSANAEYLYSRAGLSTHQFRVGLHYTFASDAGAGSTSESPGIRPLDAGDWNAHSQTTFVEQYAAPFHAPYHGANSLDPNIARETWDVTFYLGRRLWTGAAVWINPEIDQGYGLSNTLGVAGFTSGEAYKVGFTHPYARVPRLFVQQTINLGGASESVEAGLNQFRAAQTANRLVVTAGKLSVSDLFDTIVYAHDPRSDFMNWALVDAGTFDYAADAWGFTYGAAVEWYQGHWVARAGLFDLSLVPNSVELDLGFRQDQIVYELEHQHTLHGEPGKVALVGFVSRGHMGRYDDALRAAGETGSVPNTEEVRRFNRRPGLNLNVAQQVTSNVGVFGRVGWADGNVEPYEFTDIDRTVSAGASIAGSQWGRRNDVLGIATVFNGISDAHRAYLAAGGLGILVGDGQLPHAGTESIVESYYRFPMGPWQLTADYQFIVNPAFNAERGPVSVLSLRIRRQF
jgi:high affinity Mn2+ porin